MKKATAPILAAVRLDETAREPLLQAAELAKSRHAQLHICHVLPDVLSVRPLFPQLKVYEAFRISELTAAAESVLADLVDDFIGQAAYPYRLIIEHGTAHSAILRTAMSINAGLIVMDGESKIFRMSSVSEQVVRYAHCSVLVVRPCLAGVVLAATDLSDPAFPALKAGAEEAQRRNEEFVILHSMDIFPTPFTLGDAMGVTLPANFMDDLRKLSQEQLDHCVARFKAREGILAQGPAAEAILDAAQKLPAELIVVGTHGRTGLWRLALGSVAESVLRESACSVLVVRLSAKQRVRKTARPTQAGISMSGRSPLPELSA